jgi:hypothetical protein
MTTQEQLTSSTKSPNGFQHTTDKFLLCFPCIICIDNIVDVGGLYDLCDFGDNGEINVTKVKFLEAYTNGYRVTIVVLNIRTGEILKRSHRIDNDTLPCHWVLTDLFTEPEAEEVLLNDSNDSN